MIRRTSAVLLLLGLPGLHGLAASCTSTGSAAPGARLRVTLVDHRAGNRFELVSESHTSSVEYYSTARSDASRKILDDDVMTALIDELDANDFERFARSGRAPSPGGGPGRQVITRSLEIDRGGRVEHWSIGQGSVGAERGKFHACAGAMLQVYSLARSYQAIENPGGPEIFADPPRTGGRPGRT